MDSDTGFYYLRARYLNTWSGRFMTSDSYEGMDSDPQSLHKYLYANNNPVMNIDPSGHLTLQETVVAVGIFAATLAVYTHTTGGVVLWSAFHGGLPQTVEFGVYLSGHATAGSGQIGNRGDNIAKAGLGVIGGADEVIAPRQKKFADYVWGHFEGSWTYSLAVEEAAKEGPLHGEGGYYEIWNWHPLEETSKVQIHLGFAAIDLGGSFYGIEGDGSLLLGRSFSHSNGKWSDRDEGYAVVPAVATKKLRSGKMSRTEMMAKVSIGHDIVAASQGRAIAGYFGKTGNPWAIGASFILNGAGAVSWVYYNYPKN